MIAPHAIMILSVTLITLAKLSIFGFNRRALNMKDFYQICETERIAVLHENIDSSFYMAVDDKKFIVLSRKMTDLQQRFVAFHELSHHFSAGDGPTACFFDLDDSPAEEEANAFAAIALIPRAEVGDTAILDECCCGFGYKIYKHRMAAYQSYGV